MNIYFRVLTPDAPGFPGTLQRWANHKFTSSHCAVPPHWRQQWLANRSTETNAYQLIDVHNCEYTHDARAMFLNIAHLNDSDLTDEQLFRVGEFVGVAAFENPKSAMDYAGPPPIRDCKALAIFEGVRLAALGPEVDEGGCRVRVVRQLGSLLNYTSFEQWLHGA